MKMYIEIFQTFLIQLRCLLGLHKWNYIGDVYSYINAYKMDYECGDLSSAFKLVEPVRNCSCCRTKQKLDIHCLGLKPPEYVIDWVNC